MSQSPNSTDTQAVLQSMLQRLKIQQGQDNEKQQQAHVPNPVVSTRAAEEATEASSQKLDNGPLGGREYGINGIPSEALRSFEANQSTSLKGVVRQEPVPNWEVDKAHISFPAQKDNSDGSAGQIGVVGQHAQSRIPPAEAGQFFPVKFSNDVTVPSYRPNMEAMTVGSMAVGQTQSQGYSPKVFAWSPTTTHVPGSPQYRPLPAENGEFGTFTPNKDAHITSPGNKPRRWTQKIKERWKDRPGSFGKKQKEEHRAAQQSEISPLKQLPTTNTVISTSNTEEDPAVSRAALTLTEDGGNTVHTSDFEFSLGSFSLLEEITSGQEWAKFLTPNQASDATDRRPSLEVRTPAFSAQSPAPSLRDGEASPFSGGSATHAWAGDFQPVSMDVSEERECARGEARQAEPMEHGRASSNARPGWQTRPPPFSLPADIQNNPSVKSRVQMNRKRHHHLTERTDGDLPTDLNHPVGGGVTSSWRSWEMGASHEDAGLSSDKSPPLSPSFPPSLASPTKGVLKHSVSQDSQSSVEILTKRRRVEESRRVHFSEKVVTITPPELDTDLSDPEGNSGEEEDAAPEPEPEREEEQAGVAEVTPARRPALPAWIRSLKKRNSRRKHRK